jgi:hypothetical protein
MGWVCATLVPQYIAVSKGDPKKTSMKCTGEENVKKTVDLGVLFTYIPIGYET